MIFQKTAGNRDLGIYTYCPVGGKRQYRTKGEAERVLSQLKRKRKGDGSVYLCSKCGCWHTTSESWERSKGRKQGITMRKIEAEFSKPHSIRPLDPYTLIRMENVKAELSKRPEPAKVLTPKKQKSMVIFCNAEDNYSLAISISKNEGGQECISLGIAADGGVMAQVSLTREQVNDFSEALNFQLKRLKY